MVSFRELGARGAVRTAWAREEKWSGWPALLGVGVALGQPQSRLGCTVHVGWVQLPFPFMYH
jgi:hypothetical protein